MTRLTLVFAPRQDSPPLGGQVQTVARDRPDPPSVGDYHCCSLDSAVPVVDGAPSPPPPLLGCSGGEFCGAKSPSRSKAQGGWGGSAHYPDPTAQSAHAAESARPASHPTLQSGPRSGWPRSCGPRSCRPRSAGPRSCGPSWWAAEPSSEGVPAPQGVEGQAFHVPGSRGHGVNSPAGGWELTSQRTAAHPK